MTFIHFPNRVCPPGRDKATGVVPPFPPSPTQYPRPALLGGMTAAAANKGDMPQAQKSDGGEALAEGGPVKAGIMLTANVSVPSLIRGVS